MAEQKVGTQLLQALATLLTPESLVMALLYANHDWFEWEILEEKLVICRAESWRSWFSFVRGVIEPKTDASDDDVIKGYLSEFCAAAEISPCASGKRDLLSLDDQGFEQHVETCKTCQRFSRVLG